MVIESYDALQKNVAEIGTLLARLFAQYQWLRDENERLRDENERLRNENSARSHRPAGVGSTPPVADPEVVRDTPVCIWVSHISKDRSGHLIKDGSGRYSHSWVICDGTHVQYCADNMSCFVCGRPIKFAGGG